MSAQTNLKTAPVNPDYQKFLAEYEAKGDVYAAPSPYIPDFKEYYKKKAKKSAESFPIAFDLRTAGPGGTSLVTSVKHQLSCGACWAFATYGSIESVWKIAGEGDFDLSENNLKNCHGFTLDPCQWGHHFMSTSYLVRGYGPILEADDPYQPSNNVCATGLSPAAYIPESRYLPEDHDAFKETIMTIGPVYNTFRSVSANYQWIYGNLTYCYQGASSTTHAIAIVGWNDTLTTACGQGAWLVKDQYGTGWGDGGFYYISFQDTLVLKYNAIWPKYEDYDPEMIIHQYDSTGGWPFVGYEDSVAYGLIKYTAQSNEFLYRIGTYTVGYGTKLKADVYNYFDGVSLSGLLYSIPEMYCNYPGFWMIDLPEPLRINTGQDFYIHIRYNSPGEDFPLTAEGYEDGYTDPHIETGKCWSREETGTWEAWGMGTGFENDLCIKAFSYETAKVRLKVLLEGPFTGYKMDSTLCGVSEFPPSQPFNTAPWNYDGNESLSFIPDNIVDWLLIELRETDGPAESAVAGTIIGYKAVLLRPDGTLTDTEGKDTLEFNLHIRDNLYVVIYHRNHLPIMSAIPLINQDGIYNYNFSDASDKAFGGLNAQKDLGGGKFGMIAGDGDISGVVDMNDILNIWHNQSGNSGYQQADYNLNSEVNNLDKNDFCLPNSGAAVQIPE